MPVSHDSTPTAIGTLGEGPLHAAVKAWYAEPGDLIEEPIDGYVIDLVRGGGLIEIQTRGFSAMSRKLIALLDEHPVRVVHPIALERWIVRLDDAGEVISRRKSPKRGSIHDLWAELVSFPQLMAHPRFTLEVLFTGEEELRRFDGRRAWRRKGWVVQERRLVDVRDRVVIETPADLAALLPAGLPDEFTTAELADGLGRPRAVAQQMAYCLRAAGVLVAVGKRGNAIVHVRD